MNNPVINHHIALLNRCIALPSLLGEPELFLVYLRLGGLLSLC
jgi:hypothetical protein